MTTKKNNIDYEIMMQPEIGDSTQCIVYDKTPETEQKKMIIVVRRNYSVEKVFKDIQTLYRYESFDLILQPSSNLGLVYLNRHRSELLYNIPGFEIVAKNVLILLPKGQWDGNVKQRFDLDLQTERYINKVSAPSKALLMDMIDNTNNNKDNYDDYFSLNNGSDTGGNTGSKCNMLIVSLNDYHGEVCPNVDMGMMINTSPPSSVSTVTNATNADSPNLSPMSDPEPISDDDLALGASASPTGDEPMLCVDDTHNLSQCLISNSKVLSAPFRSENNTNGYVGLVNQAMTCYLNSLLQSLFMTPEFRNALYRWEFDKDNESNNIPYQLQKLFVNLQMSSKSAVETTELTRSFGWNSAEAWHQHDIQELCRVMFDALEQKFHNTKQANLIANLYEGRMTDYVRCLQCNMENTREDTFLDIPLPVRPFGKTKSYESIEEALLGFVQPEILNGNNQYFCDRCNKKCDAHKGFQFKKLPYILTLHLKRFDFNYESMTRIKLNDKVTFPEILNLNSFMNFTGSMSCQTNNNTVSFAITTNSVTATVTTITCGKTASTISTNTTSIDDNSIADSGSAMEEDNWSSGIGTTISNSTHLDADMIDDDQDEGIDISSSTDNRNQQCANNNEIIKQENGPYLFELFAIMIHSGSASGGHYYAFIKDFETNKWYCFNDQSVTSITKEDILRSYGGNIDKENYTRVYTSSTNAYMLMYRKLDLHRNEKTLKYDEFPQHIKQLVERIKLEEKSRTFRGRSRNRPILDDVKLRIYFYNPMYKKLKMSRLYVSEEIDIPTLLDSAYQMSDIKNFAPITHCRLVRYNQHTERILCSFEKAPKTTLAQLRRQYGDPMQFLLETRVDEQQFEVYDSNGATWNVFIVNLLTTEIDGPILVHSAAHENNDILRRSIAIRLNVDESTMLVASVQHSKKAFVVCNSTFISEARQHLENLARSMIYNISYLYLNVPNTSPKQLEMIDIPTESQSVKFPPCDVPPEGIYPTSVDKGASQIRLLCPITMSSNIKSTKIDFAKTNKFQPIIGQEANSDSSLSDGDRTLIENSQNRGGGDSVFSSTSQSPQLSSPEDDISRIERLNSNYNPLNELNVIDVQSCMQQSENSQEGYIFYPVKLEYIDLSTIVAKSRPNYDTDHIAEMYSKPVISYKIFVDNQMPFNNFKKRVSELIKVPINYFQIHRKLDKSLNKTDSLTYFSEGETLSVELSHELQPGNIRAKIYYMRLSDMNNETGRLSSICEWIFSEQTTVAIAKQQLIAKLNRIYPNKYSTLTIENCRLWLKGGRSPIKIYSDDEMLINNIYSTVPLEFIIQECEDGVNMNGSSNSLTIFVRRWHPDTLELDCFQEITLEHHDEIRSALSKLSDIPVENIGYTKLNGYFPHTHIALDCLNQAMSWFSIPATQDICPLSSTISGSVYIYKDMTVIPKELSKEDRLDMNAREQLRLSRLDDSPTSSSSSYLTRRERSLRIYTEHTAEIATAPEVSSTTTIFDNCW